MSSLTRDVALVDSPLRVLAWPAFRHEQVNPYTALLYHELRRLGCKVEEFSPAKLIAGRWDVWHIHWPDLVVAQVPTSTALIRAGAFVWLLIAARMRGVRIIWTVHNLRPHDKEHRILQGIVRWCFLRAIDGHLSFTRAGLQEVLKLYPNLRRLPAFVTPHGHYCGAYPDEISCMEARARLSLPLDAKVILFFGQVREYKNVLRLLRVFSSIPGQGLRLVVAGEAPDAEHERQVRAEAALDTRVLCVMERVPVKDVQVYMRSADLVVLPYNEVLNSGAALLALSFGRRVLVPKKGSLLELAALFGEGWVRAYEGELMAEHLVEALEAVGRVGKGLQARLEEGLRELDWAHIARRTLDAYRAISRGQTAAA